MDKKLTMTTLRTAEVKQALHIVGTEDFSNVGENGTITVTGEFATAILDNIFTGPSRALYNDLPVRISRMGRLEIRCNGFYVEGRGVREVVHRAARAMQ
jgi:hypothetical protein